ncbi:threonine dehydratase [Thermosporothrix hazakensis]|jgi:threonine dehydratase|uniref:threonine ammonia-lyase n=2 Tax=Thermosporothrix TaxID=768650 RepID=A0A326UCH7_THEHA|nr:threonine/serine dehydratase [Thermosporothrix hazakensis]PZW34518.1 threonine dehydratase [Thermosporothrix hazakensis]BBH85641.1 serine/threonine dehydratase [Thermosporothrix sp. COM3]GCE45930.1 serine/threonine dehydratase [Thermosporothrix hazakensis]
MNVLQEILRAEQRIRPHIYETPLLYSQPLSKLTGGHVLLKLENLQYTGSFKVRGALNALLSLNEEQRLQGVVTASSGNHGCAVAYGMQKLGMQGIIFVPEGASPVKVAAIQSYGARVQTWGTDSVETEQYARSYAETHAMLYIPPYNDLRVIGGQGTIAVEICRQVERVDAAYVAVGGGGLISGLATYLKAVFPHAQVIGCLPENSAVMAKSVEAQRILDIPSLPTLSDGTAGGIEPDAITFPLCQQLVDDYVLVSEAEIRQAMRQHIEQHHMLIEGAAGVALAALLKQPTRFQAKTTVVVLCGANISLETLRSVL